MSSIVLHVSQFVNFSEENILKKLNVSFYILGKFENILPAHFKSSQKPLQSFNRKNNLKFSRKTDQFIPKRPKTRKWTIFWPDVPSIKCVLPSSIQGTGFNNPLAPNVEYTIHLAKKLIFK